MEILDIETKKEEKSQESVEVSDHAEAVALVEKHRDFFEHYAKGRIKIASAPKGLKTFAFDLENNTIYINSMFYAKLGFSEEKTIFATLHEIEHFLEKIQILSEEGGERSFGKYLKKIKDSMAFGLMDNCVADIRENRTVVSREPMGLGELERRIYKEDLFKKTDLTIDEAGLARPHHIQLCEALLREFRVSDEKCVVSPEVRDVLDEIAKVPGLMDIMTHPKTSMSLRLKLQDKYIWPKVQALLEKDMEDKKKQEEQQGQEGDGGEGGKGEEKDGGNGEGDPNIIFADDYDKAGKKFPQAVPIEETKKAFKKWKESQGGKNSADKADAEYAQKIGVEKKNLQEYRKIVESLQTIVNPETGVGLIEELRNLFARIISKRLKRMFVPKYPVAEGDELVDPAQLFADVKSGNLEPKVWEDTEIKEKKGGRFGEVEITLVCDRSGSMNEGQKAVEQRRSAVLVMEVLKEFAEMCEEERMKVDQPLEVKSEIYSFAGSSEDKIPLKKMSKGLGEAERINVLKKLYDLPGSTADFHCLEAIAEGLNDAIKQKIKSGELKKIVIIFTDGGSDDAGKAQTVLKDLRENGVVAVGVGITSAGQPVLSTYAPNALVVEDVQKLPIVLGELLKEHLKNI